MTTTRLAAIAALIAGIAVATPVVHAAAKRGAGAAKQGSSATQDNDQTLRAMKDEMDRSKTRLKLPNVDKPFYVEYRLLDLDVRQVSAAFGAEVSSNVQRSRSMSVDVRIGDYHLDSSNFISEDGFQGFLGSTGQVGIDRDYNSLRQDLWLATDQAYKEAATQMAIKYAFLRSLTKPPEIDDFSKVPPTVDVQPRIEPDWTSRNWEQEARTASAGLKKFPALYGSHVNYYMIYATTYLMNSEGTVLRNTRTLAAIEAAVDTQADDGMPLHNFYAVDVTRPADLPDAATIAKAVEQAATDLTALRSSPLVSDYTGPMLFDPEASGSLIAQLAAPSISGARPPLSSTAQFDAMIERVGGRSEWSGRVGTRVLPATVSLTDDPFAKDVQSHPLMGDYAIDDEGVKAEKVTLVENGILKDLLMSRRPGPDFEASNGHGRSAMLSDQEPLSSNLIFQATGTVDRAALQQKFLSACKDDGHEWCIEVGRMDNPALGAVSASDFSDLIGSFAGGLSSGTRVPLLLYRVYVSDGHKELVRGATLQGLNMRTLRNILGIGNDSAVYTYLQNVAGGLGGTAIGAFGTAQSGAGVPSTVTAPSLLLEEVEVRGFHGEPRRTPLVPAPPLQ